MEGSLQIQCLSIKVERSARSEQVFKHWPMVCFFVRNNFTWRDPRWLEQKLEFSAHGAPEVQSQPIGLRTSTL